MKNNLYILDAGHGGMIKEKYQTKGKRSPVWEDGKQIFEGVLNREIVKLIAKGLKKQKISFHILVPEQKDISLPIRVKRANTLETKQKKIFVSIHSNAGKGTGYEVFTYIGLSIADRLASLVWVEIQNKFPNIKMRTGMVDGDVDKESAFYVLKYTNMPAILGENFFMDTRSPDFDILDSKEGKQKIADAYVDAIVKFENE